MFVVIRPGNFYHGTGTQVFGPFDMEEEAEDWAEAQPDVEHLAVGVLFAPYREEEEE